MQLKEWNLISIESSLQPKNEDLDKSLQDSKKEIMTLFLKYQRKGRNLTPHKVIVLLLIVAKYMFYLLKGWSFVILPIKVRAKNAIVNVQDIDQSSLQWTVLFAWCLAIKNRQRFSKYVPYADELDFTGIQFPLYIKYTEEFEDLLISVSGLQKMRDVFSLTKHWFQLHAYLLLISDGKRICSIVGLKF